MAPSAPAAPVDAAAVAPVAPTPPTAPPAPTGTVVDLLRATEATVRVSSAVANANDRPDRLVDGDLRTAWSSASGEMERTWIEVRLPADVRVDHLEMTAGYTREGGRRDLFTGNVRVSRVRVLRDGTEVGSFALDRESREMQRVPAQGPGGVWRIEMVGLLEGAQAGWREVTVSELRVMGIAGTTGLRATPAAPLVEIGPAAGAAPNAAGGDTLTAALTAARRDLLNEGIDHAAGETGCSGAYADLCVRNHWMAIADGAVQYSASRCSEAVIASRAPFDRHRRRLEQLQTRVDAALERGADTSALDTRADEALASLCEAAAVVIASCPAATGLASLGPILRDRDTTALRRYRLRP